MKKLYDLVATAGTYLKNGGTKKRFKTVGAEFETDTGRFIMLDATVNLAAFPRKEGSEMIMVSKYEPKDRAATPTPHEEAKSNGYQTQAEEKTDDIPF